MKKIPVTILLLSLMCLIFVPPSFADLTINLVAVNGSEEVKEMEIKSYLPKELEPSDILDAGLLTVQYDVEKGAYYVSGKMTFQPKESKTFKVKVTDVWRITTEEIGVLKSQLEDNLKLLEKKEDYGSALVARDKLMSQLDYILGQQDTYSQDIERRVEQYRAYADQLKQVRNNIFSLDYLASQTEETEQQAGKTIKFMMEVKNPSDTKERTVQEKHFLPKEIRGEHIIDSKGFDVRFDEKKESSYLSKEDTFKPGEVKKYEIIIQDVWSFPIAKVTALQGRAQTAYDEIKNSDLYKTSGEFLFNEISKKTDQIIQSQEQDLPIKEHIGLFRVNTKRYEETEDLVNKLEQMLAIVRAKKLEELESGKVKNVLQRLKALRGLASLSEAIFKKGLSLTTVWRIIFSTLGFVAFFTSINFFIWVRRSASMGEDKAGKEPIKEVPKPGAAPAEGKA